jgi:hypothetical protein
MESRSTWKVAISSRAKKESGRLPKDIQAALLFLVREMELSGPKLAVNWKNFGPLKKGPGIPDNAYHCHLKKGRPTYVACWFVVNKLEKKIEVFYVGSHENAPY